MWPRYYYMRADQFIKNANLRLEKKHAALVSLISGLENAVLAYSGGADSAFLAYVLSMQDIKFKCALVKTPAIPKDDVHQAMQFANEHDLPLDIIEYDIMELPEFRQNAKDRCYHCKAHFFNVIAERYPGCQLLDGSNRDDLRDDRPGSVACTELKVMSPLRLAGFSKSDIRTMSRDIGLSTWDRPQMTCLATRFPVGTEITREDMAAVDGAEQIIRSIGHRDVRVRVHGDLARIEIGKTESIDLGGLREAASRIKGDRFKFAVLDIEGYKVGGGINE